MWQLIFVKSEKPFSIEITIYDLPHAALERKAVEVCSISALPVGIRGCQSLWLHDRATARGHAERYSEIERVIARKARKT